MLMVPVFVEFLTQSSHCLLLQQVIFVSLMVPHPSTRVAKHSSVPNTESYKLPNVLKYAELIYRPLQVLYKYVRSPFKEYCVVQNN